MNDEACAKPVEENGHSHRCASIVSRIHRKVRKLFKEVTDEDEKSRENELRRIVEKAMCLAATLSTQNPALEFYFLTDLDRTEFKLEDDLFKPHRALKLVEDDDNDNDATALEASSLLGQPFDMVVTPAVVRYGNKAGTSYEGKKVLHPGVFWIVKDKDFFAEISAKMCEEPRPQHSEDTYQAGLGNTNGRVESRLHLESESLIVNSESLGHGGIQLQDDTTPPLQQGPKQTTTTLPSEKDKDKEREAPTSYDKRLSPFGHKLPRGGFEATEPSSSLPSTSFQHDVTSDEDDAVSTSSGNSVDWSNAGLQHEDTDAGDRSLSQLGPNVQQRATYASMKDYLKEQTQSHASELASKAAPKQPVGYSFISEGTKPDSMGTGKREHETSTSQIRGPCFENWSDPEAPPPKKPVSDIFSLKSPIPPFSHFYIALLSSRRDTVLRGKILILSCRRENPRSDEYGTSGMKRDAVQAPHLRVPEGEVFPNDGCEGAMDED